MMRQAQCFAGQDIDLLTCRPCKLPVLVDVSAPANVTATADSTEQCSCYLLYTCMSLGNSATEVMHRINSPPLSAKLHMLDLQELWAGGHGCICSSILPLE